MSTTTPTPAAPTAPAVLPPPRFKANMQSNWVAIKDGVETQMFGQPCFGCYAYGSKALPDTIRYYCPVNNGSGGPNGTGKHVFTEDHLKAFCAALGSFLDTRRYSYIIGPEIPSAGAPHYREITWEMDCRGLTYYKALVYLTAFRYPHEAPHMAMAVAEIPEGDAEVIFAAFQSLHNDMSMGKIPMDYALGGHGLMAAGYRYAPYTPPGQTPKPVPEVAPFKPLTISEFRARWADPKVATVHAHWPGLDPKPRVAPVAAPIMAAQVVVPA